MDWADRFLITAIDTWVATDNAAANDRFFKLVERALNFIGGPLCVVTTGQRFNHARLELTYSSLPVHFVGNLISISKSRFSLSRNGCSQISILGRCLPVPGRLARFCCKFANRRDRDL